MMKQKYLLFLVLLFGLSLLAGCSHSKGNADDIELHKNGKDDTVYEVTKEQLSDVIIYPMEVPEHATDVIYHLLVSEEETYIPDIAFTYDDKEFHYMSDITLITDITDESSIAFIETLNGLQSQWTRVQEIEVQGYPALYKTSEDASYIAWLDRKNAVIYTLFTQNPYELEQFLTMMP